MASVRKNTKLLTRILAVLVLLIWGEVAYQLVKSKHQPHVATSAAPSYSLIHANNARVPYVFKDNARDPFAFFHPVIHVRRDPKVVPLIVHIWAPPPIYFEGVMLGGGKRTVILTNGSGETFFLAQGDTIDGVKIIEVNDQRVIYSYDRKDSSWTVETR